MKVLFLFLKVISYFPKSLIYKLGYLLGLFLYLIRAKHSIIKANIEFCFKHLTTKQRTELIKNYYISLGKSILEIPLIKFRPYEEFQCNVSLKNFEAYEKAKKQYKSVILLGHHTNHSELMLIHLAKLIPLAVIYRPNDNVNLEELIQTSRERYVFCISKFKPKSMIKWLKNCNDLFLTPDQDHGLLNTQFVPFFDNKVATLTTPLRTADITRSAIIPVNYYKKSDTDICFEFSEVVYPGTSQEESLIAINQILESSINKAPEQYYWIHRRFKTLPEGKESIYH